MFNHFLYHFSLFHDSQILDCWSKNSKVASLDDADEDEDALIEKPKKKRGRPKKNATSERGAEQHKEGHSQKARGWGRTPVMPSSTVRQGKWLGENAGSELDFFKEFFRHDLVDYIVKETNSKLQVAEKHDEIDEKELMEFICQYLLIGLTGAQIYILDIVLNQQ